MNMCVHQKFLRTILKSIREAINHVTESLDEASGLKEDTQHYTQANDS